MTDAEHRDLLDALKAHRGSVLLSGYESQMYDEALRDWYRDSTTEITQTATKLKEVLWMNYEPLHQQSLF